jgi:hypothetical protein
MPLYTFFTLYVLVQIANKMGLQKNLMVLTACICLNMRLRLRGPQVPFAHVCLIKPGLLYLTTRAVVQRTT